MNIILYFNLDLWLKNYWFFLSWNWYAYKEEGGLFSDAGRHAREGGIVFHFGATQQDKNRMYEGSLLTQIYTQTPVPRNVLSDDRNDVFLNLRNPLSTLRTVSLKKLPLTALSTAEILFTCSGHRQSPTHNLSCFFNTIFHGKSTGIISKVLN